MTSQKMGDLLWRGGVEHGLTELVRTGDGISYHYPHDIPTLGVPTEHPQLHRRYLDDSTVGISSGPEPPNFKNSKTRPWSFLFLISLGEGVTNQGHTKSICSSVSHMSNNCGSNSILLYTIDRYKMI